MGVRVLVHAWGDRTQLCVCVGLGGDEGRREKGERDRKGKERDKWVGKREGGEGK